MDGAPSALLNLLPTQDKSSSQDNETDPSQDSPSGMTLRRLTDDHGKDTLMWFQADSPVRTYLPQEKAQESTDNDQDCGPKWQGSWAKYNPNSYSWKTPQCSLLGGLIEFSETWPRWGIMQNGEFWALSTPGHLTNETESGLWLTPCAMDANPVTGGNLYKTQTGTVRAMCKDGRSSNRGLSTQVKWPTPRKSIRQTHMTYDRGKSNLEEVVGASVPGGGILNPPWVEWLMGWPVGWTDLQPLAMDKFQQWSDSHGKH